tara:strand:+ start:1277 stop:1801 length:525 start_codon:yes stop_codon:yes gene_type:complete
MLNLLYTCCKKREILEAYGQTGSSIDYLNNDLENANWENTKPFIPKLSEGKVIKVYDGDSITVASRPFGSKSEIYRFSIRLRGVDSPELRSKNVIEKQAAIICQTNLEKLILNKTIKIKNISTEKYGRLLCDLYLDGKSINGWLIDNRFAVPYDGNKKYVPKSWMKYIETGNTS